MALAREGLKEQRGTSHTTIGSFPLLFAQVVWTPKHRNPLKMGDLFLDNVLETGKRPHRNEIRCDFRSLGESSLDFPRLPINDLAHRAQGSLPEDLSAPFVSVDSGKNQL